MKKKFLIFLPVILMGLLASCSSPSEKEKQTVTGIYFDTVVQIDVWGATDSMLEQCSKICETYENMFSNQIPDSDISRINSAAGAPVSVSSETIDLISKGLDYSRLSGGAFDITIAPLSDLWDFHENTTGKLPDADILQEACSHVDYEKVSIDRRAGTVTLLDPQARLDLGGIAKGYIADQLKSYLENEGIEHALLNLGGNVLALGQACDQRPFRIGIQKPFDERNTSIDVIEVNDCSVVSSGIDQRYFEKEGILYHHILNPKTGFPYDNDLLQVTVISEHSADGDALSTCCFALGLEEGSGLIRSLDHVSAIFITKDYELHYVNRESR